MIDTIRKAFQLQPSSLVSWQFHSSSPIHISKHWFSVNAQFYCRNDSHNNKNGLNVQIIPECQWRLCLAGISKVSSEVNVHFIEWLPVWKEIQWPLFLLPLLLLLLIIIIGKLLKQHLLCKERKKTILVSVTTVMNHNVCGCDWQNARGASLLSKVFLICWISCGNVAEVSPGAIKEQVGCDIFWLPLTISYW